MIFPVLKFEPIVQVDDKTRLDASASYANSGDIITKIEIDAGNAVYVNVTTLKYLDTQYSTDGEKTINVRINDTEVKSFTVQSISQEDDKLFSDDSDLQIHEPEILRYVVAGRNSFKDVHRRSQAIILDWLDASRFWKTGEERYQKADLVDLQDFKEWATLLTLSLIFNGLSDKNDDKWSVKSAEYKTKAFDARERGTYRLDHNADGTLTRGEKTDNWTKGLIRR